MGTSTVDFKDNNSNNDKDKDNKKASNETIGKLEGLNKSTKSETTAKEEEDMTVEELKELLWPREVKSELTYNVQIPRCEHKNMTNLTETDFDVYPIIMTQDLIGRKFKEMIGNIVWDGAVVMHEYFQNTKYFPVGYFKGKKVLELGAGLGLVGITLAYLGAEVYMTDLPDALEILQHNVDQNIEKLSATSMNDEKSINMLENLNLITPKVEALSWGTSLTEEQKLRQPYDMIVGADITYIKEFYDALIQSFKDNSQGEKDLLNKESIENNDNNTCSNSENPLKTKTDIYIGHLDRGEEFMFFNYMRGHGFVLEEVYMKHLKGDEGLAVNHSPNLHVYKGYKI